MAEKGTKAFKDTIIQDLENKAKTDEVFKEKLEHEDFNIDTCIDYIFTTVKESGISGFEDNEIFSMAIHYVDEYQKEKFDIKDGINLQVVVNHKVELNPEEIEEAKEKARKTILDEAREKMTKKPKKKAVTVDSDKPSDESTQSALLF